jgi:hypothetical protein
MVPVSVRNGDESSNLGNRVATMWAPLPVGIEDPRARFAEISQATTELKESGQAPLRRSSARPLACSRASATSIWW